MNKTEVFKTYFKKLWETKQYEKSYKFFDFLKKYYGRKGQKTELAYVFYAGIGCISSADQITDEMLDSIE